MSYKPAFHTPPREPSKEDFNVEAFGDLLKKLDQVDVKPADAVAPTQPVEQAEGLKKRIFGFLYLGPKNG